jgi:hypothetical protein
MKLNAGDRDELQDNLDELLGAVRELKHELDRDNQEIESGNKRNRKKKHNSGVAYNKKNKANNRRNH